MLITPPAQLKSFPTGVVQVMASELTLLEEKYSQPVVEQYHVRLGSIIRHDCVTSAHSPCMSDCIAGGCALAAWVSSNAEPKIKTTIAIISTKQLICRTSVQLSHFQTRTR